MAHCDHILIYKFVSLAFLPVVAQRTCKCTLTSSSSTKCVFFLPTTGGITNWLSQRKDSSSSTKLVNAEMVGITDTQTRTLRTSNDKTFHQCSVRACTT